MGDQRIMMDDGKHRTFQAAVLLIFLSLLLAGCAGGGETRYETGGQTLSQEVTTEYLLKSAGFQKWDINQNTPSRQALLMALPPGKITTYKRNGQTYHAYADVGSSNIYVGDDAAYQRYLSLAGKRQVCERVTGANQVQFWSCMEESQQGAADTPKQ
ncbi:MAG: hypothetical protein PHW74_11975 [Desulfobacca sp.]|nr:hypothetical protein [Desulfobacca sp.]